MAQAANQQVEDEDKEIKQQRTRAPAPPHPQQNAAKPNVVSGTRRKVVERGGMGVDAQGMSGSDRM
jgi:hypothetical protein